MAKKHPVSLDNYKRFHFWLIEQSHMYGVVEDPDVRRAIEILVEKLENHASKEIPKKAKNPTQKKVFQFVQVFKQKYLEWKDLEYDIPSIGGKEIKIINTLMEKLDKHEVSIDEYVTWLFDDFYPDNPKMIASIYLSVSNNIVQNYLYKNADILKKRKNLKKIEDEEGALLRRARVIFRATKDENVVNAMKDFQQSTITLQGFTLKINELQKKHKNILDKLL